MSNRDLKHETLILERICVAPVERVFAAFADPVERANWGTPSETAAFIYDKVDFREGGSDVFRCGDRSNPQYRGVTTYHDIVPDERIISSEVVETEGRKLLISMATTALQAEGSGTRVIVTVQLTSLAGEGMLNGAKFGHNASLDNLVKAMAEAVDQGVS
ncbi:MAG TPA: SRPBCC domain-containing protein [Allosphingosinicella sp.]|nr:SRPBCC domain-containing protein [Allosphingosinicella sp.]